MARRLFAIISILCCFATNALANKDKGVPLEYASVTFIFKKKDTLQLKIQTTDRGKLNLIQLEGSNLRFPPNDSIIHFFQQFMIHGLEIGTKPEKVGGKLYIHPLAPTNYEGLAIVVNGRDQVSSEKVLSTFVRKQGTNVKLKDYKPKKFYSDEGKLKILSMHLVYDLGVLLGKMEIKADSKNNSLYVNAFDRVEKITIKAKTESITSISLYELKQNSLYLLKLTEESVRLPIAK